MVWQQGAVRGSGGQKDRHGKGKEKVGEGQVGRIGRTRGFKSR